MREEKATIISRLFDRKRTYWRQKSFKERNIDWSRNCFTFLNQVLEEKNKKAARAKIYEFLSRIRDINYYMRS